MNHLREQDLSYRYARLGESLDDYEESYYESDQEDEQDLEYPCLLRQFDDNYAIENMMEYDDYDNQEEMEV